MKLSGGPSSGRKPRVEARSSEREGPEDGCPPPQGWGSGVSPGKILKFETQFGAIQGSFPAGTPGNGIPKVILTLGTAFPGRKAIVR